VKLASLVADGRHPNHSSEWFPVSKDYQGWNTLNMISAYDVGVLINIQFYKLDRVSVLVRQFVDRRSYHLARTAPVGVEVNKDQERSTRPLRIRLQWERAERRIELHEPRASVTPD
jgi:hypothetical protein